MSTFDFLNTASTGGAPTSSFTVTVTPASPIEGEPFMVTIEGDGGFIVADPIADIALVTDFGTSGAVYTSGAARPFSGSTNADTAFGRCVVGKLPAGSHNLTVTGYVFGQGLREQTVPVTVQAQSAIGITKDAYISFSGNTAGFPAVGGAVSHITSYAAFMSFAATVTGSDVVRLNWRAGETHNVAPTADAVFDISTADIWIERSFGAGGNAVIGNGGSSGFRFRFLMSNNPNCRRIVYDVDYDGRYNPVTGALSGCELYPLWMNGTISGASCTFAGCEIRGCNSVLNNNELCEYLLAYDCAFYDWRNYGIFSHAKKTGVAGCVGIMDPLTGVGDTDKTDTYPNWPDHAWVRLPRWDYFADHNNDTRHRHGWSVLTPEHDEQPTRRWHQVAEGRTWLGSCCENRIHSGRIFAYSGQNGSEVITGTGRILVEGNLVLANRTGGQQSGLLGTVKFGGAVLQNNVCARANLRGTRTITRPSLVDIGDRGDTGISAATAAVPCLVRCNTLYWAANFTGSALAAVRDEAVNEVYNVTQYDNVIAADSPNTGMTFGLSLLSPGANFAPVQGTAADAAQTGPGSPYFYAGRSARPVSPRKGALPTVPTRTTPAAVTITDVAISLVNGFRDQYMVTALAGTLDKHAHQFLWQVNGANPANQSPYQPFYLPDAADNGTLTCTITTDYFGSSLVSRISNQISLGSTVPAFSAASTNAAGTEVYVDVSGGPISGTWATTGFTVKANGHRISLASASEANDRITLVIGTAGPLLDVETVTVEYDGTGSWTNGANQLPAFSAQAVTNNSTVSPDTTYSGNFTPAELGASGDDFSYTSGVDHIVDAYAATWNSRAPKDGGPDYPVTFRDRGGGKTTVVGLTSNGHHDATTDWGTTYNDDVPRDNTANINMKNTGGFTILRNVHVTGYAWDAIRAESDTSGGVDTWLVEGAYIEFCRDDFVENDKNCSGTVRDCLFDNGFAGISFTPDQNSAAGKSVTMEGLRQKVTPYLYNGQTTHFGPCVKLSSASMTWSAQNCVFAFDKPDHRTDYVSLGWSKLTLSANNFLLNLSDTPVSGSYPLPPAGWTFLQGQAARDKWNAEKAAWLAAHGYS